ncbi:transcriptional regulator [Actinobacillus delphinicola]|uniref:helix-turn-helix domain-containing protein n=1 Tax=Actinobacillus delphinicola TaxID=51161 RepID=UPI000F8487E2|nr:helix-turn-helix transcriptional regulator [Actinobacillus delphinicola]MDG6897015.1 transcriptional regulator [Actinobacillus delphinicola]
MKTIYKERYRSIIQKLIARRKELNLTQQQIAAKLNKPQSYIAKIEGFERKLDVLEFIEICEAIELDPSSVLHDI